MRAAKTHAKTHIDHPTFETVWAALQETDQIVKGIAEQQREIDRIIKENAEQQAKWQKEAQKENAERQKENAERKREIDQQMKEFNKRFGDLTNRFGEVVEYMIAPNLREKFMEFGLNFPQVNSDTCVSDYDNNIFFETDFFLQNGDKAMLVEVKTKLTAEDVKDHVKRLEKMRTYADLRGDKRSFLGAVAGVVMTPYVKNYALAQGFFVVEPSGETFNITPPQGEPKEW
jgi:hypothetical protein